MFKHSNSHRGNVIKAHRTLLCVCAIIFVVLRCDMVLSATGRMLVKEKPVVRRISVYDYIDKMKAGWVGQMAGVGWGYPTEFQWCGKIIPEKNIPVWKPETINQFYQDDLYVEMTFLRTLELHGPDVSIRQAGIDFANSGYGLWHANRYGRDNLRKGIAPPDSSHPQFTKHSDDIDYQIESDFAGLISPGLPNVTVKLGEKFGRLLNYGDGLYGGQFVGAMYSEAFFEKDPIKLVEKALNYIPAQSQYAEAIRDTLKWYHENPDDWKKTWQLIDDKYQKNPSYRKFSCAEGDFNIDAKINGAYIIMGLLYGKGDLDQTIVISMRCGHDSDCNPSNAAGVLFTMLGFNNLPDKFTSSIDYTQKYIYTEYSNTDLFSVCEKLARDIVIREGGRIENDASGNEVFVIPVQKPSPSSFVQSWQPGPIDGSMFTLDERRQIKKLPTDQEFAMDVANLLNGWNLGHLNREWVKGSWIGHWLGRNPVLRIASPEAGNANWLTKTIELPANKKSNLKLTVTHHEDTSWELVVKINRQETFSKIIGPKTCQNQWQDLEIDLSSYAGQTVNLLLLSKPTPNNEVFSYWANVDLVHR